MGTLRGNGVSSDPSPASDHKGGSHFQHKHWWHTQERTRLAPGHKPSSQEHTSQAHSEGSKTSPRWETVVTGGHICVHSLQGTSSVVWHNPSNPNPASNQGIHSREKVKPAQKQSPQALATPQTKAENANSLQPWPCPNRAVMTTEHWWSPCLYQPLVLAPPTPALLPTKAVATSTQQVKMRLVLTLDATLSPKPMGTWEWHKDSSRQGRTLKPW